MQKLIPSLQNASGNSPRQERGVRELARLFANGGLDRGFVSEVIEPARARRNAVLHVHSFDLAKVVRHVKRLREQQYIKVRH